MQQRKYPDGTHDRPTSPDGTHHASLGYTFTAIRFEFLYPCILFPNTGRIPDRMICPTLACFVFFSKFLSFSTIAFVLSLSALFVPTCTSLAPQFPLPMILSILSVTLCSRFLLPENTLLHPPSCSIVNPSSEL